MSVPANYYANTGGIRKTRFKELGYVKHHDGEWQHVDFNDDGTVSQIGRRYPSEKQLLADHERYAASYGCENADRPVARDSHKLLSEDHKELAEDIRAHVWTTFDSRTEFSADDIGKIAHRAEMAVLDALVELGYGK